MRRATRAERMAEMDAILERHDAERSLAVHTAGLEASLIEGRKRRIRKGVAQAAAAAGGVVGRLILGSAVKASVVDRAMAELKPRGKKPGRDGQVVAYRGGSPLAVAGPAMVRRDSLAELLRTGAIDSFQHAAGVTIRALWIAKDGGAQSPDPGMIKVDGGGRAVEAMRLGALAASEELRRILAAARLGAEDAEIVLRICGESQTIMAVAIGIEDNPAMLANGGCSRETADRVKFVLKRSLRFIANVIHGRPARGPVRGDDRVSVWLGDGARPVDLERRA